MGAARVAAFVTMAALTTGAAKAPRERVVSGDGIVVATINGASGRLRIDPAAPAMPLIVDEWARRARLKGSFVGIGYAVGPRRIMGESAVARIALGGTQYKRRVGWLRLPYDPATQGIVGPGGLPEPVVRFQLREPGSGERTAAFRMVDGGGLGGGWGERFALVDVGGVPLRVRFDPLHPRTLATAGAGRRLADSFGGRLEGEPPDEEIAFGIRRPVRGLSLGRPLLFGPFVIERLGVRIADFGSTAGIPDAKAEPDPDEVVVTARNRDTGHDRLALGSDQLARCSSIVFDKPARQIRLTCR